MPKKLKSQKERFLEAAREHGCEDAPDIDEVMRRLAAQKRRDEKPAPKSDKSKSKKPGQ